METERLVLRPRRVEEAAVYRQRWTERDARVPPHRRIDAEGRPSVADVAARLGREPGILAVELKSTGEVIGCCGLLAGDDGPADEPELAYELLRAAHGHGYATEAGRAVVAWAGGQGLPRLWAHVWDWNVASRQVLLKLGLREAAEVVPDAVHGENLLTVFDL